MLAASVVAVAAVVAVANVVAVAAAVVAVAYRSNLMLFYDFLLLLEKFYWIPFCYLRCVVVTSRSGSA